jgi:uncharacterized membrane protein YfcA
LESELRTLVLFLCIALAAALYSAVGQGGGSGYLAVLALFGMSPETMRPAALSMNLAVSSIVWWRLYRAGHFRRDLFFAFAITSVPMAFVGGALKLHAFWYNLLVGTALLVAALRLFVSTMEVRAERKAQRVPAMFYGAGLGLVSGITGVGGGIFLSPLLLFLGWCTLRENFALAAAFIWVNSLAAILGYTWSAQVWPQGISGMIIAALCGTFVSLFWSERVAKPVTLQRVLGGVLLIAAAKMMLGW